MSLHCKLVQVQYQEYEYSLVRFIFPRLIVLSYRKTIIAPWKKQKSNLECIGLVKFIIIDCQLSEAWHPGRVVQSPTKPTQG